MLTAGSGCAKQATGEVRPHCGKTSENRPSGVWHGGQADESAASNVAIHDPTFQWDQSRAIVGQAGVDGLPAGEMSASIKRHDPAEGL